MSEFLFPNLPHRKRSCLFGPGEQILGQIETICSQQDKFGNDTKTFWFRFQNDIGMFAHITTDDCWGVQHCKKKVSHFPIPSQDVNNRTLPCREKFNYSVPGRGQLVTSRLGKGKWLTFFLQCTHQNQCFLPSLLINFIA